LKTNYLVGVVQKVHVVASEAKQSASIVPKISRLLRRGVYPEPVEGLLAKTFFGFLDSPNF